jgi:hypothetical protein
MKSTKQENDYTALLQPVGTKQETPEEAYLNKLIDEANKEFTLDRKLAKEVAIKYSKWQQEQDKKMYSEEEVLKYVDYYEECYAERPTKKPLKPNEWFEQNKKK